MKQKHVENRAELRNESTLAAIAENIEGSKHSCIFGVIIDITETKRQHQGEAFLTSFKVIDPSFNYKSQINNNKIKFHKFFKINVFSEVPEKAPSVAYIGDIIRLRRFSYKITDRGQIIGYEQKFSNWLIYPGYNPNNKEYSEQAMCCKTFDKNIDRKLNDYEKGRLEDLRDWSYQFFSQNSISYINWWNWHKGKNDNVDLIVKFDGIYKKQYMVMIDD